MRTSLLIGLLLSSTAWAAQPTQRPTDEQRGEALYRRHCVACHGVRNGGKGPATTALVHPVPALQGKVTTSDAHIRSVLKGINAMPGFEASFARADAVRVLKYMKALGPDKALPAMPTSTKPAPQKLPPQKVDAKAIGKPDTEPVPEGPEREEEE